MGPLARVLPSPKFQLNEYGEVPPVAVAVNVTGLPTVGLGLTVKVTASACAEIVRVAVFDDFAPLTSVTVAFTVFVPFDE